MSINEIANNIKELLYTDSLIVVSLSQIKKSIILDIKANNISSLLTKEDCELFVLGDCNGRVPQYLCDKYPNTHKLLNSFF
jgi:hypothetical protein